MIKTSIMNGIINHLAFLIEQDTQNPPRRIDAQQFLFEHLTEHFEGCGFTIELTDLGGGHVIFYAIKGHPTVLFNVHLDTVPVDPKTASLWQKQPLKLTVENQKVYGRGSCDIKGAAGCLMALAQTASDMAVLFTTDEEGTNGCCVQSFIDGQDLSWIKQVVVAEPANQCATKPNSQQCQNARQALDQNGQHCAGPGAFIVYCSPDSIAIASDTRRQKIVEKHRRKIPAMQSPESKASAMDS